MDVPKMATEKKKIRKVLLDFLFVRKKSENWTRYITCYISI